MAERIAWDEEFTLGPEGPYGPQYDNEGRAVSILGALKTIEKYLPDHYEQLKVAWNVVPETDVEGLAERIGREIRKVDTMDAEPVRVWATADGTYKLSVYPKRQPDTRELPSRSRLQALSAERARQQPPQIPVVKPAKRPREGILTGVVLNPKTLQPCLVYWNGPGELVMFTSPAGYKMGQGDFESARSPLDKYRRSQASGYPRVHTPDGVNEKGKGYGTVLYAALALTAYLNSEQVLNLDLEVDGPGISSNEYRDEPASRWWAAPKQHGIAFEETYHLDDDQAAEYGLSSLAEEQEFETTVMPGAFPELVRDLNEILQTEEDIYPDDYDDLKVTGTQLVSAGTDVKADVLPFAPIPDRALGVRNLTLAACAFNSYAIPSSTGPLREPAVFAKSGHLDFNDDVAMLVNLQGVSWEVFATVEQMFHYAGKDKLFEFLRAEAVGSPMGYLIENPARTSEQRKVYEKLQIADFAALPD